MYEFLSRISFPRWVNAQLVVGLLYLTFMFGIFAHIAADSDKGFGFYSVIVFFVTFVPQAIFGYLSALKRGIEEGRLEVKRESCVEKDMTHAI